MPNENERVLTVSVVENVVFHCFQIFLFISVFRSSTAEEPPVMEEDPELDDGDPLCNSFNSFCKYLYIVPPPMAINYGRGGWVDGCWVCLPTDARPIN